MQLVAVKQSNMRQIESDAINIDVEYFISVPAIQPRLGSCPELWSLYVHKLDLMIYVSHSPKNIAEQFRLYEPTITFVKFWKRYLINPLNSTN